MEDRTIEILENYLDSDFTIYPMAETDAELEPLDELGARLGVRFPAEFVAHVTGAFPGIYLEVKPEVWPPADVFAVGPFWTFLRAIHTFTPAPSSADWMRIADRAAELSEQVGAPLAPVLAIQGDADVFCVDATGQLVRFDHELGEVTPDEAADFWELFEREVADLVARRTRYLEEIAPKRS